MNRSPAYFFVILPSLLIVAAIGWSTSPAPPSDVEVGQPAPEFTLQDTEGTSHSLSDYEGQFVVLEWVNFECPFVGKHYGSGNMQALQETYTDRGVAWLSINSSGPDEHGYFPPEKMSGINEELGSNQTALLPDPTGRVGRAYGATNTPHMYVISPDGVLLYKGGIDDRPTTDEEDIEGATNYVAAALEAARNGRAVSTKKAPPYGCTIQYAPEGEERDEATGTERTGEEASSDWDVGDLRPNGLRIEPGGRSDASAVLDPEQFSRPEVRNAYRIATEIPAVLNHLYCWCGCQNRGVHRSNLACFEDEMATHCAVCRGTAEIAYELIQEGTTDAATIQAAVDRKWGSNQARDVQKDRQG